MLRRRVAAKPLTGWATIFCIVMAAGKTAEAFENDERSGEKKVTGKLPDVTDGTFQSEVLDSEQPVLVDFWAPWCGPCRVVHPILEEMAAEREDFRIVSLNTDENQQTAAQFEVLSIPTLILFKDGAEAKRVIGAMPKRRLESELEPALA
jgi:thioredoxin 1